MSIHVFLGPSLSREEARGILDAHYLPPVSCGDVLALMADKPSAIGIIDGYFKSRPAVFHKEILFALSRGIPVFGASSMGALRAAELGPFGMTGVGRIYEAFAAGETDEDDEVTVAHGPASDGYRPYSEAMVNIRHGLDLAREAGHITSRTHDVLITSAKATFYPHRSWAGLRAEGRRHDLPEDELAALESFIAEARPDLKAEDARAMLQHMAQAQLEPVEASFRFNDTVYWQHIVDALDAARRFDQRLGSAPIDLFTGRALLYHNPDRGLRREALFYALAHDAARRMALATESAGTAEELESLIDELLEHYGDERLARFVPFALTEEDRRTVNDAVDTQWQWLREEELHIPRPEQLGVSLDDLVTWFRERTDAQEVTLEDICRTTGVTREQFVRTTLLQLMYESGVSTEE